MMWFLRWLESWLPKTTINVNGIPYLTRCYLLGKDWRWGNVYLHHFHSSDQGDELHSHPWSWGLSLVLAGGYFEERSRNPGHWSAGGRHPEAPDGMTMESTVPIEKRDIKPGRLNLIKVTDFHRVDLKDEKRGAWTLFFTGPRSTDWGFLNRHTSEFTDWRRNPEAIP
jgi:hypothetical protein